MADRRDILQDKFERAAITDAGLDGALRFGTDDLFVQAADEKGGIRLPRINIAASQLLG